MRRIKGMADYAALGVMLTTRLNGIHGDAGCAGSENHLRRSDFVHLGEHLRFQHKSFRYALLNKVRLRHRFLQISGEGQSVAACARSKPNALEYFPRMVDPLAYFGLRVWRGISRDDVKTACEILRRPTRADQARTHDRYVPDLGIHHMVLHGHPSADV